MSGFCRTRSQLHCVYTALVTAPASSEELPAGSESFSTATWAPSPVWALVKPKQGGIEEPTDGFLGTWAALLLYSGHC